MNTTVFYKRVSRLGKNNYAKHLLKLDNDDRYMRFAHVVKDASILKFVENTDFSKDGVIGAYNSDLKIIGAAHIAVTELNGQKVGEIALSVDKRYRKQGIALELFRRALIWGQNQYLSNMEVNWLNENQGIAHMVKHFGGEISSDYVSQQGMVKMEKPTLESIIREVLIENIGLVSYGLTARNKVLEYTSSTLLPGKSKEEVSDLPA